MPDVACRRVSTWSRRVRLINADNISDQQQVSSWGLSGLQAVFVRMRFIDLPSKVNPCLGGSRTYLLTPRRTTLTSRMFQQTQSFPTDVDRPRAWLPHLHSLFLRSARRVLPDPATVFPLSPDLPRMLHTLYLTCSCRSLHARRGRTDRHFVLCGKFACSAPSLHRTNTDRLGFFARPHSRSWRYSFVYYFGKTRICDASLLINATSKRRWPQATAPVRVLNLLLGLVGDQSPIPCMAA